MKRFHSKYQSNAFSSLRIIIENNFSARLIKFLRRKLLAYPTHPEEYDKTASNPIDASHVILSGLSVSYEGKSISF